MSSGLKKFALYLLNSEVVLPLVWGVVFLLTLITGRYLFGQEYGFLVGGGSGVVLASLATYAVAKRLPYGLATDVS